MTRREALIGALLRQRRFLVLTSLALAAYYILRVHVKGDAEYSGFAVVVGRPDRAQYCLWVIFGWALLRYWQRFNELWDRVRADVLKNVDSEDRQIAFRAATRDAYRQFKGGQMGQKLRDGGGRLRGHAWLNPSLKEMIRETRGGKPVIKSDPDFGITGAGGRQYRSFAIAHEYRDRDGNVHQQGIDFVMPEWSRARTLVHRAHAWGRATVRLPAILEHLAPFLIAVLAICTALALMWNEGPPRDFENVSYPEQPAD